MIGWRERCGRAVRRGSWLGALCAFGALACAIDSRTGRVLDDDPANEGRAGADSEAPTGSGVSGSAPTPDDPSNGDGSDTGAAAAGTGAGVAPVAAAGSPATPAPMAAGGAASTGAMDAETAAADPGAAAMPGGAVPAVCAEQLLANGDFEAGDDGSWNVMYDARAPLLSRDDPALGGLGVAPQSGDYMVWLGGVRSGEYGLKYTTRISQPVAIPENAVRLTFSGYVWVTQPEPGLPLIDWAVLELLDPGNVNQKDYSGQWQIALWNESSVSEGWVPFEAVKTLGLETLRGRTLTLVADSRPDGNGTLNVWVDSLRLQARCE